MGWLKKVGGAVSGAAGGILGGVVGGLFGGAADRRQAKAIERAGIKNAELQRDFAQHGIRWRVADAEAAGIHPLAALGASVGGASPAYQVGDVSSGMRDMGQDIGRAISATMTREEKIASALRLENMQLQNDLLRAEVRQKDQTGPSFPGDRNAFIPGQGNVPAGSGIEDVLVKVGPGQRDRPAEEPGQHPYVSYFRSDTGLKPRIPNSSAEALESDYVGVLEWNIDNKWVQPYGNWLMDKLGKPSTVGKPSYTRLPKGANDWRWHPFGREWQPIRRLPNGKVIRLWMNGREYGESR